MQIFRGVASGKQSFRKHCVTKWLLEANPRNISASKISRYTVASIPCQAKWPVYRGGRTSESRNSERLLYMHHEYT